jgi:hypothetical protein
MTHHIIDTNVLLVASAHHPDSPFQESSLPAELMQQVLDWLMAFRKDGRRTVVLDQFFKIWDEYHNKMTGQDIGLMVVTEKLQTAVVVDIEYDRDGHGRLPPGLEVVVHDRSDRKFVAVALEHLSQGGKSTIVNAVDTDWHAWDTALKSCGITVTHLVEGLARVTGSGQKQRRKRAKR